MFAFQKTSCSLEASGEECGQVPRHGAGSVSAAEVSSMHGAYVINKAKILDS
jgi:hypothetical protein